MNVGKKLQQKKSRGKMSQKVTGKKSQKKNYALPNIMETCPCNKHRFFNFKNCQFSAENFGYFSYFCSKNRLWVHEAVLASTHYLCFGAKIRKIGLPLHTPVFLYERGV